MMDWSDNGTWMNGWGMALMVIFWVAIIGLVIWAVIRTSGRAETTASHESPRQILDRRFAAGEMTSAEYVAAGDMLSRSEPGTTDN